MLCELYLNGTVEKKSSNVLFVVNWDGDRGAIDNESQHWKHGPGLLGASVAVG